MVQISRIIEQNSWWKGEEFIKFDKKLRDLENARFKVRRRNIELQANNIYAIYGPRQSGKTTFIKSTIKNLLRNTEPSSICYFVCDNLISGSRMELRKVIDFFLEKLASTEKGYIFLDEINFVKDWTYELKNLVEEGKLNKIALLITGSPLGIKQSELLPGRNVEGNRYFLKPLTFREFILQLKWTEIYSIKDFSHSAEMQEGLKELIKKLENMTPVSSLYLEGLSTIKNDISELMPFKKELDILFKIYLKTGGFPQIINDFLMQNKIDPKKYEIILEIILSDIRKQGKSDSIAKQLIHAISKRTGSMYDFRALARDFQEGISSDTVNDYLKVLEGNFMINILYSYDFKQKLRRIKGNKKIYFSDPFVFHSVNSWLTGKEGYQLTEEILLDEEKVSLLCESLVLPHLLKLSEVPLIRQGESFLWFYYDKNKEIDYVLLTQTGHIGIEVKYTSDIKKIHEISELKNMIVLTKDILNLKQENKVIVPLSIFLSLLPSSTNQL